MIRSVVFVLFISIALTQCSPPNNKNPPLKLNKLIKTNSAHGKPFGSVQNHATPFDVMKLNIKNVIPYYEELEYAFGERVEGDGPVGVSTEINFFENEQDIDVIAAYPNTGSGKITVTYVEVQVLQDTTDGNVEISQGGISQQEIGVKVVAKQTKVIAYHVVVYGILN
ncbi:uncharacterized protein LOC129567317 [Sitodiplosis mosellana]|uniref:uncharacterized protein LOC129567317 n=1 Tax=Sitodiplosis mosellana TaxID=263140 RepID=UPI002445235D|nr:uncharacterized protein LOC129567317 [Sitodiplosis mosellana]